jgi:hypothetical protein
MKNGSPVGGYACQSGQTHWKAYLTYPLVKFMEVNEAVYDGPLETFLPCLEETERSYQENPKTLGNRRVLGFVSYSSDIRSIPIERTLFCSH